MRHHPPTTERRVDPQGTGAPYAEIFSSAYQKISVVTNIADGLRHLQNFMAEALLVETKVEYETLIRFVNVLRARDATFSEQASRIIEVSQSKLLESRSGNEMDGPHANPHTTSQSVGAAARSVATSSSSMAAPVIVTLVKEPVTVIASPSRMYIPSDRWAKCFRYLSGRYPTRHGIE